MRDVRIDVHPFYPSKKINQCPGIPDGMLQFLIKDERCTSRCIKHRDSRDVVEYWVIPCDLASDWGMEWVEDIMGIDADNIPIWAKHTEYDEISLIDYYSKKDETASKTGKTFNWLWSGPLAMGWRAGNEGPHLNYLIKNTPMLERNTKRVLNNLAMRARNPKIDLRDKHMVDYYLKTGNLLNAVKVGFPHMGQAKPTFCINLAGTRLQKKSVRKYMNDMIKKNSEELFKEAGIDGDPQDFVMKSRLKLIKKALDSDNVSLLNTAERAISKVEDALAQGAPDTGGNVPAPVPASQADNSGISKERKEELAAGRKPKGEDHVSKNENDSVPEVRSPEHPFDESPKGSVDEV